MAKIGTAHIEVKSVLNEEAIEALCSRLEDAIADAVAVGVERGMAQARPAVVNVYNPPPESASASALRAMRDPYSGTA